MSKLHGRVYFTIYDLFNLALKIPSHQPQQQVPFQLQDFHQQPLQPFHRLQHHPIHHSGVLLQQHQVPAAQQQLFDHSQHEATTNFM